MAASAACWWASRLEYPEPEPTTVPLIAAEAVKMGLWALSADVPVIVNSQERCRFCAHSRSVDLKFFRRRRQVVEVDVVLDEPRCESGASAASEVEKCRADECFKGVSAEEAVVRLYVFGEHETLRQSDGV